MAKINVGMLPGDGVRNLSELSGLPSQPERVSSWIDQCDPPLSAQELGALYNALLNREKPEHAKVMLGRLLSGGYVDAKQAVVLRRLLMGMVEEVVSTFTRAIQIIYTQFSLIFFHEPLLLCF